MKIARVISLLLLTLVMSGNTFGQGCAETLTQAETEFAAGRFYSIPSILNECIEGRRFTNEQLVRVYLLLTQVYLLTDDPIGADASYLKLLDANPEYVSDENVDPIDVVYLSKKFTTTPRFTPHFKAGVLESRQTILRDNHVYGNESTVKRKLASKVGWTVGAGIEWNINDNWGLGGEFFFASKAFGTTYVGAFLNDSLVTSENQFWADVPIYVRYTDSRGKIRPYGYLGHSFNFLLRANLSGNYTDRGASTAEGQVPVGGEVLNVTFNRELINRSLVVGGGIKVKSGKDYFLVDLRLAAGLTNISKGSYYDDSDPTALWRGLMRYGYLSNDFRLNSLVLTVGYVRPLYDPRKIKKPRTRAVSRKMTK